MPIQTLNITKPFAENGDRSNIPAFSQNEQVSYDTGWTEAYSRLTSDLFFNREDINGILYSLSIACIINDENMQIVKTDCETEAQNIKDALDAAKTALQNSIDLKDAQINLNMEAIAVNANDIAGLLRKITDIENQIAGGNLDNNALDAIRQAVALLQTEVQELMQCCDNVNAALILKADAANVYTKTEADDKFAEKASIAGAFIYKQEVETIADLPPNADNGSVYLVKRVEYTDDEGNISFNEVMYLKGDNGYTPLSPSMLQINSNNFAKLDRQNVFAMTNKITTPNAVDDNDIVTFGEVKAKILESENNQQQSNTQFATDINQLRQDLTRETTDRQAEDDKLDLKIRQNIINIGTNLGSINALDARVLRLEQGGGGAGGGGTLTPDQLANLAQLNQANTFTKENTFNMGVQIPTAPKDDDSAVNKGYVTAQQEAQLQLINEILKDYVKLSDVKEVDYFNQLPNTANIGEVYKVVVGDIDKKAGYYLWDGNTWRFVGNSVQDIESAGFAMLKNANTFTKINTFQDDVLLEGGNPKTPDSAVNKRYLESQLNNHTQEADLKYVQKAQPNNFTALNTFAVMPQLNGVVTNNNDATTKAYVDNAIVNAINGQVPIDLSAYAQVSQANNWTKNQSFLAEVFLQGGQPTSLESAVNRGWVETYVATELANNVPQIDTSDLAKLSQDNTFTGVNHFTLTSTNTFNLMSNNGKTLLSANNVNMQVDMPLLAKSPKTEAEKDQIAENEFVTKAQVAFLGGGGGVFDTTANYTWTGNNIFNGKLESGTTAASIDDLTDTEVPTKKLIIEKLEALMIKSDASPSGNYPAGTLWIKHSYTQDPNNFSLFTDKPELYISLGNSKWWALHKEELL
ncbi:hypothetical protein [Helicobacter rodentium]|uniref:hypothetical protein n=9 Tax=Helicobacter TaxID=209 RepID=UPI002620A936|nr:hypothetical protein [Helicobacter rodentium]